MHKLRILWLGEIHTYEYLENDRVEYERVHVWSYGLWRKECNLENSLHRYELEIISRSLCRLYSMDNREIQKKNISKVVPGKSVVTKHRKKLNQD